MSLINTFVEAIKTATKNMANYKEAAKKYTDKVESGLDELDGLIKRLSGCIKQLVNLQQDYNVYIQQISRIRINMQTMLDQQITQARNDSGEDCDNKIRGLLEKFNAFVQTIGTWEKKGDRFRGLLDLLTKEIDKLCEKANQIMIENEDNQGGRKRLEREISELEEKLGEGNQGGDGASKDQNADNERKEGPTREEQEARLREAEAELARRRQQADQSQQPQQRQQRTAQEEREARIAQRTATMRARRQRNTGPSDRFGPGSIYGPGVQGNENYDGSMTRGQGAERGGWQTPQKLESISRYSPIRRVTRKKKNKKRKKKRRKKQTKKRRGKKRN